MATMTILRLIAYLFTNQDASIALQEVSLVKQAG